MHCVAILPRGIFQQSVGGLNRRIESDYRVHSDNGPALAEEYLMSGGPSIAGVYFSLRIELGHRVQEQIAARRHVLPTTDRPDAAALLEECDGHRDLSPRKRV